MVGWMVVMEIGCTIVNKEKELFKVHDIWVKSGEWWKVQEGNEKIKVEMGKIISELKLESMLDNVYRRKEKFKLNGVGSA